MFGAWKAKSMKFDTPRHVSAILNNNNEKAQDIIFLFDSGTVYYNLNFLEELQKAWDDGQTLRSCIVV